MSLQIYDIAGKEIAVLAQGFKPPGFYRLTWDGKNSSGQPVPSGVYFYRLTVNAMVQTKEMTMVQ